MKCYDRMSGERFQANDESEIREYLREPLSEGETAAYSVTTDTGEVFDGEVSGWSLRNSAQDSED